MKHLDKILCAIIMHGRAYVYNAGNKIEQGGLPMFMTCAVREHVKSSEWKFNHRVILFKEKFVGLESFHVDH